MKRLYALLFNLTIISTHGVAKTTKNSSKLETNRKDKIVLKSTKLEDKNFKLADYKVKNGDTLFIIARKHHTTIAQVELVNNLAKNAILKIGQPLKVPVNTYKPKQKNSIKDIDDQKISANIIKIAKEGDTLLGIALDNGTTLTKLAKLNNFSEDRKLKLGETILIPQENIKASNILKREDKKINIASKSTTKRENIEKEKQKELKYTIKDGDTLLAIALDNGTTLTKLTKLNNFSEDRKLKLGETILIPLPDKSKKKETKIALKPKKKETKIALESKKKKTKIALKPKKKKTKIASKSKKHTHIITKGDTLYKIAIANDTTVAKLKKINKLDPKDTLKLGDIIYLTEKKVTTKKSSKIAKIDKNKIKKSKKKSNKTKIASKVKKSKKSHTKLAMKKKSIKKSSKNRNHKIASISKKRSKKSLLELLGIGGSSLKLAAAKSQLGKRYVWGATGPYSFDCSGFTKYVCDKNGVCIPRTSIKQSKIGQRVSREELKAGDLIFFDTSKRHRGYVNHVGIYIGNNKFIHASSAKRKVVITSLETPFYKSRFKWGSRVKG